MLPTAWNSLARTSRNWNVPSGPLSTAICPLVAVFVNLHAAPGTTAPLESTIVPLTVLETVCPIADTLAIKKAHSRMVTLCDMRELARTFIYNLLASEQVYVKGVTVK